MCLQNVSNEHVHEIWVCIALQEANVQTSLHLCTISLEILLLSGTQYTRR